MRLNPCSSRRLAAILLVVGAIAGAVPALAATGSARSLIGAWREIVGDGRAGESLPLQVIVVLHAPAAVELTGRDRPGAVAAAAQSRDLKSLRDRGLWIREQYRYTNAINGFSATVRPDQLGLIEASPEVAAVYRVRRVYPAGIVDSGLALLGDSAKPLATGIAQTGASETIALLDGPVDTSHPYLAASLVPGWNAIRGEARLGSEAGSTVHATAMAGIAVGQGGPVGLHGVSQAKLMPIQVLELQHGELMGTTATLLAGIDRALDPNGDGDLTDRARVLLAPVAEPIAGFADSAETDAARGVEAAGSVLVSAAGNDGPTLARFGTIATPAASPFVLAVGASDGRSVLPRVSVKVRIGEAERTVDAAPLAGVLAPAADVSTPIVRITGPTRSGPDRAARTAVSGGVEGDFRGADGTSLVEGKAVLVERDGQPLLAKALAATAAGATALVLYGDDPVAAGALGLDDRVTIPVVVIPQVIGVELAAGLDLAVASEVRFSSSSVDANDQAGRIAPFSSYGLAFDDHVKPDLVAPGVAVTTSAPAGGYAAVSGTSVAAAQVAGAIAVLREARPELTPAQLRGIVTSSARPVAGSAVDTPGDTAPVEAQGGGELDLTAALTQSLAPAPSTLSFGAFVQRSGQATRTLRLTNLGSAPVTATFALLRDRAGDGDSTVALSSVSPSLTLAPGTSGAVDLTLTLDGLPREAGVIGGWIVVAPEGAAALRVPWSAATTGDVKTPLIRSAALDSSRFAPGAEGAIAARLVLGLGDVGVTDPRVEIAPVGHFTVDLLRDGAEIARIVDERHLLPGTYRYGLTGHDPKTGKDLEPGRYELVLSAHSLDGITSERRVGFTIVRR